MTSESTVSEILASQFDTHEIVRHLRRSDRNTVWEVSVDDRRAICKLPTDSSSTLGREGAVMAAVDARTPVPVPEVLSRGDRHLVLSWAPGAPYDRASPRERRRAQLRAVGDALARLHRATRGSFEGHGEFESGGGPLTVAEPMVWPDRLAAFVERWADALRTTPDSDVGSEVVTFLTRHRECFRGSPPVLVHGEPCPEHVHFVGERVTSVLDWEIAQAAPGAFDVVWAERDFLRGPFGTDVDRRLQGALWEGYEAVRQRPPRAQLRCEFYRAAFATRDLGLLHARSETTPSPTRLRAYVNSHLETAKSLTDSL